MDGKVEIRTIVDRPMMEIVGQRGRVYITKPRAKKRRRRERSARSLEGVPLGSSRSRLYELDSIWTGIEGIARPRARSRPTAEASRGRVERRRSDEAADEENPVRRTES